MKIMKLGCHMRIIAYPIKKKGSLGEMTGRYVGGGRVQEESGHLFVLLESKETIKDSHSKDHKSQLKSMSIDKR